MGYMVHHAFLVTFWNEEILKDTHEKAKEIFKDTDHYVTDITPVAINGNASYFVAPDGSKAGWDDSIKAYKARVKFIEYLKNYEPYSPYFALVQYGDENGKDYVVISNNNNLDNYQHQD